jgi:hypothetical protein
MRKILYIAILIATSHLAFAQEDSLIHVQLTLGGGWGFRTSDLNVPNNQLDVSTRSPCGSLRLMWKPEHMLSVGIESGYLPIAQVEAKGPPQADEVDGNANLAAIPILATFAMDQDGVEFAAGIGAYSLIVSGTSSKGKGIKNSAIELGYSFSASYTWELSQVLGLGLQVKYYVFTDREIAMIVPQLRLAWTMLSY